MIWPTLGLGTAINVAVMPTFNGRIEQVRFKNKTLSPRASSISVQEPNAILAEAFEKASADLSKGDLLP